MNIGRNIKICLSLLAFSNFAVAHNVESKKTDYITYEWLAGSDWTDHCRVFKKIFTHMDVENFLEFGLGYGTKFFLINCANVTSCEIVLSDSANDRSWFNQCIDLYSDYPNWSPELYVCKEDMLFAENKARAKIDPGKGGPHIVEINTMVTDLTKKHYDVAFVDPGIYLRGEIVQELFGKVNVIVAHDTNAQLKSHDVYYGWDKIITPPEYEKIMFRYGAGTTVWVNKNNPDLIKKLKMK